VESNLATVVAKRDRRVEQYLIELMGPLPSAGREPSANFAFIPFPYQNRRRRAGFRYCHRGCDMDITGLAERHRLGLCADSATTYDRHGNRIDTVWTAVELANGRVVLTPIRQTDFFSPPPRPARMSSATAMA
jgi:hypothetical protein